MGTIIRDGSDFEADISNSPLQGIIKVVELVHQTKES